MSVWLECRGVLFGAKGRRNGVVNEGRGPGEKSPGETGIELVRVGVDIDVGVLQQFVRINASAEIAEPGVDPGQHRRGDDAGRVGGENDGKGRDGQRVEKCIGDLGHAEG